MARRRRTSVKPSTLFTILAVLGVLWVIGQMLQEGGFGLFVLCILLGLACLIFRIVQRVNARKELLQKVQAIIDEQTTPLIRRRAQLVRQDAYGKLQLEKWQKEISYFLVNHVEPRFTQSQRAMLSRDRIQIEKLIASHVETATLSQPAFQVFSDNMSPADFEIFCAEELRRNGWIARVTMQSRDQGVDVIAEKGTIRVVLQCKLYSSPVGNKAVQEAVAARGHEKAHYGVVVTNNRYTEPAEQLASTNGIVLLHFRDLCDLDKHLSHSPASAHQGIN